MMKNYMLKKVRGRLEDWKIGRSENCFPSILSSFHSSIVITTFGMIAMLCSCSKDPQKPGLEFMPDMYRSSAYGTYEASKIFADSVSALKPVAGTIPRGYDTYFPYANDTTGYETAGRELKNPLEISAENIAEGKRLYNIFCINCHGEKGDGNGTLRIKGEKFPGVPNYATAKSSRGGDMKNMPD